MGKIAVSTRIEESLLAEIDNFAHSQDKTRSDVIESLLREGLLQFGVSLDRLPGWDAKEISRVAVEHYGGMAGMFEKHKWPERGASMMPKVQMRVKQQYESVEKFVKEHPKMKILKDR
jgi:hypothetical protein